MAVVTESSTSAEVTQKSRPGSITAARKHRGCVVLIVFVCCCAVTWSGQQLRTWSASTCEHDVRRLRRRRQAWLPSTCEIATRTTRHAAAEPIEAVGQVDSVDFGNLDERGYLKHFEGFSRQLGRQKSCFPTLIQPGARFSKEPVWEPGINYHYVILTNAVGNIPLGWAYFEEKESSWYVHWIWVSERYRRRGLASYMLRYIDSATQYPASQRQVSDEVFLLSGQSHFYTKVGYEQVLESAKFRKTAHGTEPEFEAVHAASRRCMNGRQKVGGRLRDFRLHVLSAP